MGSVVISGATSGAITLAVPAEAGTHTVTIPAATGQLLNSGDLSSAGDTAAGNAAAVGYTAAEGLILTGQGSTSDVTIKNDADATVLCIPTGTTNVGIGSANALDDLHVFDTTDSAITTQLLLQNQGAGSNTAGIAFQVSSSGEVASTTYAPKAGILFERQAANGRGPIKFMQDNAADNNGFDAGDEVMRIQTDGKVGIGTTAPDSLLEISSGAATTAKIATTVSNNYAELIFEDGNAGYAFQVRSDGAQSLATGSMVINDRDTGSFPVVINEGNATNTLVLAGSKVGIGLNAPATTLHVKSPTDTGADVYAATIENAKTDNGTATTGLRVKYTSVSPGDGNHMFQCLDSGGTVRFFVQNNGTRGGTSDRTLKENIVDATDKLAELRQLQVRNYNWIDHGPEGGFKELGFIAQEVEAIFPKMIRENPETGKKMLLDDVFVPILVKSLQEAADKIDALEARITALEA